MCLKRALGTIKCIVFESYDSSFQRKLHCVKIHSKCLQSFCSALALAVMLLLGLSFSSDEVQVSREHPSAGPEVAVQSRWNEFGARLFLEVHSGRSRGNGPSCIQRDAEHTERKYASPESDATKE